MMTNTPPNGAFRGFGAPQTQFASRCTWIASPRGWRSIRCACATRTRSRRATRPPPGSGWGDASARRCCARPCGGPTSAQATALGAQAAASAVAVLPRRGFTGGGEVQLASRASLELTETAARILVARPEIGQGTRTMHAQIVAETLGCAVRARRGGAGGHGAVPDSGPTVASRTCMVVGRILQRCAEEMKQRLGELSPPVSCAGTGRS
jgi:CO/xanthine dehydrogenase Mo-binding subunit